MKNKLCNLFFVNLVEEKIALMTHGEVTSLKDRNKDEEVTSFIDKTKDLFYNLVITVTIILVTIIYTKIKLSLA